MSRPGSESASLPLPALQVQQPVTSRVMQHGVYGRLAPLPLGAPLVPKHCCRRSTPGSCARRSLRTSAPRWTAPPAPAGLRLKWPLLTQPAAWRKRGGNAHGLQECGKRKYLKIQIEGGSSQNPSAYFARPLSQISDRYTGPEPTRPCSVYTEHFSAAG